MTRAETGNYCILCWPKGEFVQIMENNVFGRSN